MVYYQRFKKPSWRKSKFLICFLHKSPTLVKLSVSLSVATESSDTSIFTVLLTSIFCSLCQFSESRVSESKALLQLACFVTQVIQIFFQTYADLHFYNSLYTPTFCSVLFSIYSLFCLTIAGLCLPLPKKIQERKDNLINHKIIA